MCLKCNVTFFTFNKAYWFIQHKLTNQKFVCVLFIEIVVKEGNKKRKPEPGIQKGALLFILTPVTV